MDLTARKPFVTLTRTISVGTVGTKSRLGDLRSKCAVKTASKFYWLQKIELAGKARYKEVTGKGVNSRFCFKWERLGHMNFS